MKTTVPLKAVARPNEGMKQTKPAVFSVWAGFAAYPRCWADPSKRGWRATAVLVSCLVVSCDSMIASRFVVSTPADHAPPSPSELLAVSQAALLECGLSEEQIWTASDEIHWRNPEDPPGISVLVRPAGQKTRVVLSQDLYGPVGPTDTYRCATERLLAQLRDHYGSHNVEVGRE